jgi:CRP-like cAMP-binding protein
MPGSEVTSPSIENQILAALPKKEYERLRPYLKLISLQFSEVIYEAGATIRHVYFPHHSMISLLSLKTGGKMVEVGVIGHEGMVGLPVFLGTYISHNQVIVQVADGAMRMKASALKAELKRGGALPGLLLRYTHTRIIHISQRAACNSLHTVRERLCRWLLMVHDRVRSDVFSLTHGRISNMLGVRRTSVTEAAGSLQQARLINYSYGKITILNRRGLERAACECYRIAMAEGDRFHGVAGLPKRS